MSNPSKTESPNIYRYHDYREFLRAWFQFLKALDSKKSLNQISKLSSLALGYLPSVLSGKMPLSEKALEKLVPHLGLNQAEINYLKLLRTIGETNTPEVRLDALKKVQKVLTNREANREEVGTYRYLTKWYYMAIREMVDLPGFKLDEKWIQERLRYHVPLREIRTAIQLLTEHGYISTKSGKPKIDVNPLDCSGGFYPIALHQHYEQLYSLAREALFTVSRNERNVTAHTVALGEDQYNKIVDILGDALNRIVDVSNKRTETEAVYHVNLSAFPLAGQKTGGSK